MSDIKDVSTEKLARRRRFFTIIAGIYVGAAVFVGGMMMLDIFQGREISRSQLISGFILVATFWIPMVPLRAIRTELNRRALEE